MVKQRRRSAAAVGFQNIEVVPSEALESALRERQQLCKHGEAWARRSLGSGDVRNWHMHPRDIAVNIDTTRPREALRTVG